MKSGKFTAAQIKGQGGDDIDAVGQLIEMCEKEGFIPKYYIDKPNDKVDETLMDLKGYTKDLVYNELNLGNLIEQAIKTMSYEENKEEDEDINEDDLSYEELSKLKDNIAVEDNEDIDIEDVEAQIDETFLNSLKMMELDETNSEEEVIVDEEAHKNGYVNFKLGDD
jgi:hypothetical protein